MRYETEIRAYDVMDSVWISARVWETNPSGPGRSTVLLTVATRLTGEGEPNPATWLRDLLVGLAETL